MTCCVLLLTLLAAPPASIAGFIERQANQELGDPVQVVKVRNVRLPARLAGRLDGRNLSVEFVSGEDFSGRSSVRVIAGKRTFWASVEFVRMVRSCVAARNLRRGERIGAADVTMRLVAVGELGKGHALGTADVVGMILRRPVKQGQPLRPQWLERPIVVRRGQNVLLQARASGAVVQVVAKALASGRVGDWIPVKNLASGKRVAGRVEQDGLVVVDLSAQRHGGEP
ncbi:MAG: flagella basal body P-ring formation protein FlgA [Deltaproteobacteria bacterium]|nr:MAG: flagella basal body P-ring formation protein FlgA [Deltaproteobacteria bacterium]